MASDILGIMVTRHRDIEHIAGVTKAARAAGKSVSIFLTDEAVRFTKDPAFLELLKTPGVEFFCCDHSCERFGIHDKVEGIIYGSQYNNATMLHDSSRMLVF